ncbi:discoidin domain-containing protein [Sphingobacterium sp. SYP-B4668]|uniref:discoidin domain-containing protein n=1 Tax=Sphingobacterium sp. SYP-B4668 TaxID=2996035 RepID=UPI0022DCF274|nr:discoidin domain-containing protein [Sphingobacterium sp. SYP-B4668]
MKKILNSVIGVSMLLMTSCSNKEHFDVTGDSVTKIFVNTQTSYINNLEFNVIHTPTGNMGDQVQVKIPVRATEPVTSDVSVSLAIDNSLLKVDDRAVPTEWIDIEHTVLKIASGTTHSVDSLVVNIPDVSMLTEPSYLIPIRIKSISGSSNSEISSNLSTIMVRIKTRSTNVYNSPTSGGGTIVTNRAGWTATVDPEPTAGLANNMFTTSTSQHWTLSPAAPCHIQVDMQAQKTDMKGIQLSSSNNYRLTNVETFTSNDGTSWTSQGTSSMVNANNQYIRFYAPVSARYIRIAVLGWQNNANIRVSQYYIFQ